MAISHSLIKLVIAEQREEHTLPSDYIPRLAENTLQTLSHNKEIIVLTGLRRSGKSVLLHHIRQQTTESDYYFNFEDERSITFTVNDFQILHEVFNANLFREELGTRLTGLYSYITLSNFFSGIS